MRVILILVAVPVLIIGAVWGYEQAFGFPKHQQGKYTIVQTDHDGKFVIPDVRAMIFNPGDGNDEVIYGASYVIENNSRTQWRLKGNTLPNSQHGVEAATETLNWFTTSKRVRPFIRGSIPAGYYTGTVTLEYRGDDGFWHTGTVIRYTILVVQR